MPIEHVAGPAQGLHLALENAGEAEVVGAGGENAGIGGKSDRGESWALELLAEDDDQFGGDVLRVGGAAAVPAHQYLVALGEGSRASLRRPSRWARRRIRAASAWYRCSIRRDAGCVPERRE